MSLFDDYKNGSHTMAPYSSTFIPESCLSKNFVLGVIPVPTIAMSTFNTVPSVNKTPLTFPF